MRVLQLLGVLLFVPSALVFYHIVDRDKTPHWSI